MFRTDKFQVLGCKIFDGPKVQRRTIPSALSTTRAHASSRRPIPIRLDQISVEIGTFDRKIYGLTESGQERSDSSPISRPQARPYVW